MLRQTFKRLSAIALCAVLAPACGGGSGGSSSGSFSPGPVGPSINDVTHPFIIAGTPGTHTLVSRGGTGSAGNGGNGNLIRIRNLAGSNTRILPTGSVDVSFTVPAGGPGLGPNPRTISGPTTLGVGTGLTLGSTIILGDDGLTTATGLHVQPGVTLTLEPNFDNLAPAAELDTVSLSFSAGVLIEGAVVGGFRQGSTVSRSWVNFSAAALRVSSAGSIDTAGEDAAPGNNGGSGGRITLQANAGVVINQGTLISSGGSGDVGGTAGEIDLFASNFAVFSTGTLTAVGGTGNVGVGGNGGQLWIAPSFNGGAAFGGGGFFSGTANTSGGDGQTGGGNSATFFINVTTLSGPIVFNGTATMSGGNAISSGNGGSAVTGFAGFTATGTVRASGSIISKGGNGAAGGNGGTGGQIFFWCRVDVNSSQPVGDGMFMSLSADSSGGTGAVGGAARDIQFLMDADSVPPGTVRPGALPLWVVGYTGFDSSGGNGTGNGGNAGSFQLRSQVATDAGGTPWLGSLFNEVSAVGRGGDGAAGSGGNGAGTLVNTDAVGANRVAPFLDRRHINRGDFDLRGGTGSTTGGAGGSFTLDSTFRVENYGDIQTTGGTGGSGNGGAGGAIRISSDGVTLNEGSLTADGGGSTVVSGGGGQIVVDGRTASHKGAVSSRGGSGGIIGGNGGAVAISSWDGAVLSSVSGAVIGVQAGTGVVAGAVGTVFIDGVSVALTAGSITFP